ncbi:hypothetical protein HPB51_012684 [Rhipicephalus microplus]|uniref:Uncharacterized protein n=1 Tax=Rhipicephalus microplus TaxID=6941 RepID=A0A9J6D583_RHIMP|nr:hypothetical protein HPB51_012684 [Rhipicephalus microplus]
MRLGRRSIVSKVLRASKMPRLPRGDIKVIVRPRNGLNIRSTCGASLDEVIRNGAEVGDDEMITICPNPTQNILMISTTEEGTATKIAKMKVLTINEKRSRSENRHHPQQDIGGATPGGKQKGPRKITWRDIVTGTTADSAQGHPLSGRPWAAADPGLATRMENMKKENKELRQELAKARKQNEKSTRKIEELQQTPNEILKRMGGHPAETPFSGASSSHEAADERDTTSAVGDGDTDMGCGGEYEAPVVVGFKRKSRSDSQQFESTENHAQEPKRARPAGRKIDVIEEMVDKLINMTERLFETLLIRLNESDAERNAQYAAVNNQLAHVNKRIEYLVCRTAQLQQQGQGHDELGGDASTILNRSSNVNTTHPEKGGTHGQSRSPNVFGRNHGCVPQKLCDVMDENMSAGRTWKILRHLLNPTSTRTATRSQMAKLRHTYKDDPQAFVEEIIQTHLTRPGRNMHPAHDLQRRKCRAAAILKAHGSQEGVLFVNAARYPLSAGGGDGGRSELPPLPVNERGKVEALTLPTLLLLQQQRLQRQRQHQQRVRSAAAGPAFSLAVLDTTGKVRVTASARLPSSEAAEEMAIALAVLHSGADN